MEALPIPLITSGMVLAAALLAAGSLGHYWDRISGRYVRDLTPLLESLSIDRERLPGYLRWWGISIVATFFIVCFVLGMPPVAIVLVYFVYVAPRLVLQVVIARRRKLLRDQMVGATAALANTCRAGLSLAQGLESASREAPAPLADELGRIVRDYQHGRPLAEAIDDTKRRLQLDSFTLFASAILVSLERGGRVTEALDRISQSLEENQRVERKLEAETASGKAVVWLLAAFPFGFIALFAFLSPEGTWLLFTSLFGQLVLVLIVLMVYVSVRWSMKILDIEL